MTRLTCALLAAVLLPWKVAAEYAPAAGAGEVRPGFVVAVLGDWDRSGAAYDALTVNRGLNVAGGWHGADGKDAAVPVPEFCRAPRVPQADAESGCLAVDFCAEDGRARVRWQGGNTLHLGAAEQYPLAWQANCPGVVVKAVLALPEMPGEDAGQAAAAWGVQVLPDKRRRENAFSDGNNTPAWAPCAPKNMGMAFRLLGMERLAAGLTVQQGGGARLPGYALYLATLQAAEYTHPAIAAGEMYLDWQFTHRTDKPGTRRTDHTDLAKVYTVFGESTWGREGALACTTPAPGTAILPWEGLLNYLTRLCLCDANPLAAGVAWNPAELRQQAKALRAITHGVRCTARYPAVRPRDLNGRTSILSVELDGTTYDPALTKENRVYGLFDVFFHTCSGCSVYRDDYAQRISFTMLNPAPLLQAGKQGSPLICVDVANILSVLPRICGFPGVVHSISARSGGARVLAHQFSGFRAAVVNHRLLEFSPKADARTKPKGTAADVRFDAYYYDANPLVVQPGTMWRYELPSRTGAQTLRRYMLGVWPAAKVEHSLPEHIHLGPFSIKTWQTD